MKILMVNYEFPPIGGGGGQAHQNLLREYAKMDGLEVDVLTSGLGKGLEQEKLAEYITIYKIGLRKKNLHYWKKSEVLIWLYKARRVYDNLIKNNSYDLVHAFFGFPSGWLCYRSRNQLPYIISLRGSDVPGNNPRLALDYKILAPIFRKIWRKATGLVAPSQGLRDRAYTFFSKVDIHVIPNGVDLEKFKPATPSASSNHIKLLTAGRLSASKRIDLLIDVMEILHRKIPAIRLTIVGGGALEEHLKGLVIQKQLHDAVDIRGIVPSQDMPELYREHDLYVSATFQEGMSNAMLEAMASGLPIVTTHCEGVEELILNNGIVVEKPKAKLVAEEIEKIITNTEKYKQMSLCARKQADGFSWSHSAKQYNEYYHTILLKMGDSKK
jgi:glycosyltransferase involved in cell wall biosynthesis